jgi:formyltetrahydrofolate deformylase
MMRSGSGVQFVHRFGGGGHGGVEAEGEIGAAHVVVNCLRYADDFEAVFRHFVRTLQGAVAADGDERVEFEFPVIGDDVGRSIAFSFGVTRIVHVGERVVAVGGTEDGAADGEDAGDVVPFEPLAFAAHQAAKGVKETEHAPAVRVDGRLDDAAHDGVQARAVAAAGEDADALDAFHRWQNKRVCYDEPVKMKNTAILLIDCPDRKGIVAAVADFLYGNNANILHADQHQDGELGLFLMRVEWDLADFKLEISNFKSAFGPIAEKFQMRWRLELSAERPRVAIFVSQQDHCLADLLYRHESGELACEIPVIVSNHEDARRLAEFHRIPFQFIPVEQGNKADAERQQLALLREHRIDLVVLARYMQILSADFVARYPQRIINVHHSFLPAFSGARPYHRAFERGVKLIGATSHYVTETLDDGPIIEQDVVRISHRDQLEDLIQKGRDLEKMVLSRAVCWHLDHRILVYAKKTVVFD